MTENAVAKEIVDAAFRIHTALGPGLLESVYQTVLAYELGRRGLRAVSQQAIPVVYESVRIDTGIRADLVVEDKVIVEIKSVECLAPVHKKQLLTYLRLAASRESSTASKTILTQSRKGAKTCRNLASASP